MASKITDRDHGYRDLMTRMRSAQVPHTVTIGVHEEEGDATEGDSDATVLEVAEFNEFGMGVPERSFIRAWSDEKESEHKEELRKLGAAVVKGTIPDVPTALNQFGARAAGTCKQRIIAGIPPANADSTIEKKGSSTPLIDQGQLLGAITWKVNQ